MACIAELTGEDPAEEACGTGDRVAHGPDETTSHGSSDDPSRSEDGRDHRDADRRRTGEERGTDRAVVPARAEGAVLREEDRGEECDAQRDAELADR